MDEREQGRFCPQCQKTVVDFTGMTDAEVLGYFAARAGKEGICGRLLSGQLGRDLAPGPVQRSGWSGWRWVLASALMLVKPPEKVQPSKVVAVERRVTDEPVREQRDATMGIPLQVKEVPKVRKKMARFVGDSVRVWRPSIARIDPVKGPTVERMVPVINRVMPVAGREFVGFLGGVQVVRSVGTDTTILQKFVDTLSAWAPSRKEDFVTLYPNPVAQGGVLHLAWLSREGKYQLALLNMRGQLVSERIVEVSGAGQVDQWVLPVGLAAGVYAVRVLMDGSGKVMVREVMVK
jgi:hypothetical protein